MPRKYGQRALVNTARAITEEFGYDLYQNRWDGSWTAGSISDVREYDYIDLLLTDPYWSDLMDAETKARGVKWGKEKAVIEYCRAFQLE